MRTTWVVIAVCLLSATARAEDPKLTEAKAHFKQGRVFQDTGAYDRALEEYKAAYTLAPLPDLLFNIGQVYRLKGEKQLAIDNYNLYLKEKVDGPAADEARLHVAKLTNELDAQRQAEKAAAEKAAAEKAAAEKAEEEAARKRAEERAREVTRKRQEEEERRAREEGEEASGAGRGLRIGGLVTGGVGLLLVGAGAYFGKVAGDKADFVSGNTGPWTQAYIDADQAGKDAARNAVICVAAGGLAVAGGVALFVIGRRAGAGAEETALLPLLAPGVTGLAVGGSF